MCASLRAKEGRPECTREDNCVACVSWDDVIWDLYKNIQLRQHAKQRKIEKIRTSFMSSEDSVSMHPEGEVDFAGGTYQVKSVVTVPKHRSPAPWDTDVEDSPRKLARQASRSPSHERSKQCGRSHSGGRDRTTSDRNRPDGSVVGTQSHVKTTSHPAGARTYRDWCTRDVSHAGTGPSQDSPVGTVAHKERRTPKMGRAGTGS